MNTSVRHILKATGAIELPSGRLIAYYDFDTKVLHIDGHVREFYPSGVRQAMDLVAEHFDEAN